MTDALLSLIAGRFGTPTYVYDLDVVTEQVARLAAAFPFADIRYAVKANANGALLRHLVSLGVGAEALTEGELERALRAGFAPARIVLGGPGHTPALARRAAEAGVGLVSLDSVGVWRVWREADAPDTRFLVRVNPGFDPHTHEHLATAAATSKFGEPAAAALAVAGEVAATGRLAGFHVHAGSMLDDETVADLVVAALEPLYADFPDADLVDFGGGLAVPHAPLVGFAAAYERFVERSGKRVLLEPGRFVIAEAGTLLTRVLHVKEGARRHVIADAGMADLLRPALYGARHPVHLVEAGGGSRGSEGSSVEEGGRGGVQSGLPTDVDGPLCENADRLGQDVELPAAAAGDLLAVGTAGAYGFAMASNYAGSLRPAEVAVRAGEARLVRRRERPEDLWRLEDEA
ncbi:MAG: diaminopimelate decarboxylase [Trueperaceae bacterium]|nr:diaminopimelate decarboxylase [Trueperaceae bacterium]MCO5172602.1 diaminopimelate decarboxylase [Trueperaceae bacterium]MCW5819149.1 diaminopimelate decarboxylase [Trueperaceae bacterium]